MADSKKYNGSTWEHSLRKLTTATDTLTALPADVYADGNNATVGLKGNTIQSGTPTPDNPIMPQGTGERTGNLFDVNDIMNNTFVRAGNTTPSNPLGQEVSNVGFNCSGYIPIDENTQYTVVYPAFQDAAGAGMVFYTAPSIDNAILGIPASEQSITYTFTTPIGAKYLRLSWKNSQGSNVILNTGSTAIPYEPYGIKIPISSGQQTTNIYLGSTQTVRQIKKLVLTGEEASSYSTDFGVFYMQGLITDYFKQGKICVCSHFQPQNNVSSIGSVQDGVCFHSGDTANRLYFKNPPFASKNEWIQFLAAQYAAGTPVTVWYVLATPETAVVNEPLMKIGDYADTVSDITVPTITGKDTFDVETTLKPSESSLSYTGWHDATVEEWDGSQWNE